MYKSYKERRKLYKKIIKNRDKYSTNEALIGEGTTNDFTLSINDVADILGFSVEHVQNNILTELDVCDLVHVGDNDYRADARLYMNNNRLKRCVSKSSLEKYITSALSIYSRREIVDIAKDSVLIKDIKELLGKRAKIQELLNDSGKYLDEKYNADGLMKSEQNRIERLRAAALDSTNNDFSVLHYLEIGSLDVAEIVDYYNKLDDVIDTDNSDITELFDILTFDMYSIKDLKKELNIRHTMQVYRYINKVSHIAIKLNDSEYEESNKKLSDRNIRYIISNKDFTITKGVYRLPIDYYVHEKLKSLAQTMPGLLSTEDILNKEILAFAEANKEKYTKKEEEQDEK